MITAVSLLTIQYCIQVFVWTYVFHFSWVYTQEWIPVLFLSLLFCYYAQ